MAYDNFLIDKRVVERNITKGLVDPELLKQQIESLPDRELNCVHVSLEGTAQAAAEADVLDAAVEADELDSDADESEAASEADAPDDEEDEEDDEDDEDDDDEGDDEPEPEAEPQA